MVKPKSIVVFFFVLFLSLTASAQCAMCKAVVENGDETMAEGINSGISYLMVFPYLLVGALFFFLYRYRRTAKN